MLTCQSSASLRGLGKQQPAATVALRSSGLCALRLQSQRHCFVGQISSLAKVCPPKRSQRLQTVAASAAAGSVRQPARPSPSLMSKVVNGWRTDNLANDIYGGLTASVVALPLALAFGVASGK